MTEGYDPRAVPESLDPPFATPRMPDPPSSPGTGYMPERDLPVHTLPSRYQRSTCGVAVPLRTVHVVGELQGAPYTMYEAQEHHKRTVTITRGSDVLARLEPHDLRSSMLSIRGGPPVRLRDWLHAQQRNRHSFPIDAIGETRYEWRRTLRSLSTQYELYAPGCDDPIAFSRNANVIPLAEDELDLRLSAGCATRCSQREPYVILSLHAGAPAEDSHHTASLSLSPAAVYLQDMVVVSYLLLDRETMGPLSA